MSAFCHVELLFGFILCYVFHSRTKDLVYKLKYWLSYAWEWSKRKRTLRTIPLDRHSKDAGRIGLNITKEATEIEQPRKIEADLKEIDGVDFSGSDRKGNVLRVRLHRRGGERADVWMYFCTADGSAYQLPHQPDTTVRAQNNGRGFLADGLFLEVLEPLRSWRLVYSGFLKKLDCASNEEEFVVVHFDFLFKPFYSHVSLPDDFSLNFKAKYIADQSWSSFVKFPEQRFKEEWLEQFGQIRGTFEIDGGDSQELLVRGIKTRRHGIKSVDNIQGKVSIQGIMEEGTAFHIFGDVSPDFHKNYIYGYTIPPSNMGINFLEKCDLDIKKFIERKNYVKDNLDFKITAGGVEYRLQIAGKSEGCKVYEGDECDVSVHVWEVQLILNGSIAGCGIIEVTKPNDDCYGKSLIRGWDCHPLVMEWEPDTEQFSGQVVKLCDVECRSSKLVGGKGSSLAKLVHLKSQGLNQYLVPSGLSVTNKAFEQFFKSHSDLKLTFQHIQDLAWRRKEGNVEAECQRLVDLVEGKSISLELKKELGKQLLSVFGTDWERLRYAIRSSAIGIEDSDETSSAGQNETYLGVQGLDMVCQSIVKCWASQFAYRSMEYKRQNGQLLCEGMGVVVQQMVAAEVAGVIFTRDPLDGNPSKILLTCNYGLGESVVSGVSDPDTVVLNRTYSGQVSMHSKTLGTKSVAILMNDGGGTEQHLTDSTEAEQFSISDEDALRLGRLAVTIEEAFGSPRDIEWAISSGNIYLLQVRPVTTGYVPTDFEIMHEADTGLRAEQEHFTTANVGEVMPGCTHPLTYNTVTRNFEVAMQMDLTWKEVLHRYDPNISEIFPVQFGRVMLDRLQQKSWQLEEKKGGASKAMEVAIYGRVLDDEDIKQKACYRYGNPPLISKFNFSICALKGIISGGKRVQKFIDTIWNMPSAASGALDLKEAYERILQRTVGMIKLAQLHIDVSFASCIWNMILFQFISRGNDELTLENYQDFATLIGSCNGVESGNVPASLQELADSIASNCPSFSSLDPTDALKWLQNDDKLPGQLYKQFLQRHGHRCRYEFDLGRIPWNANEINFITILQSLVKSSSNKDSIVKQEQLADPFQVLHVQFTPFWRKIVSWIYQLCRDGIRKRELSKSTVIKYVDGIRKSYTDLGKMMVREGIIPEERLIFFLNNWEVGQIITNRSSNLIRRAKHRRRLFNYMEEIKFPEMVDDCFHPESSDKNVVELNGGSVSIKGFPVCKGIITARACVVKSFSQCNEIQQGDILITHSTDIAWSPYFPLLSGVVTEIGGLVSHGAVVAREFGLPCIVGAFDATKMFETGDKVTLDATKGILCKVAN